MNWKQTMLRAGNASLRIASFLTLLCALVPWVAASAASPDAAAKNTFSTTCSSCHGPTGKGDTPVAQSLKVADLTSAAVQSQTNEQLSQVIANGRGNMPSFKGSLSADQINTLVAYIRTLSQSQK